MVTVMGEIKTAIVLPTDLHTHILPGMDDGARTVEDALKILRWQKRSGVQRTALTPHFYPMHEGLEAFLERRRQAYDLLMSKWDEKAMPQLQLGAEVRYSAQLAEMDLSRLTLCGSHYLLLELSNTSVPAHIEQVLHEMFRQGFTPILAHVERCIYFRKEPARLTQLINMGALAQVSMKALGDRRDKGFAEACLRNGCAHIIASDIHSLPKDKFWRARTGNRQEALFVRAESFAQAVWMDQYPPVFTTCQIKKGMFGYF